MGGWERGLMPASFDRKTLLWLLYLYQADIYPIDMYHADIGYYLLLLAKSSRFYPDDCG